MQALIPVEILTITASSEHTYHPAEYMLDESPRIKWYCNESTIPTSAYFEVSVTGAVDSLCLLGVVADSIALTVSGSAPAGLAEMTVTDTFNGTEDFWATFTALTGSTTLRITLTRSSGDPLLTCGRVMVGTTEAVTGVLYPLEEGLFDTGEVVTMSDRASTVYVPGQVGRMFSGQMLLPRTTDARTWLRDVGRTLGSTATFFHVAPDFDEDNLMLYGRMRTLPQASHGWPTLSQVSFELTEMV